MEASFTVKLAVAAVSETPDTEAAEVVGAERSAVIETNAERLWLFDASLRVTVKFFAPSAPEVSSATLALPVHPMVTPVLLPLTQTVEPISPFTSTVTEFALVTAA